MVDRVLNILDSSKIKILFLLLSLAYSFNFIFWGFDFTDSFYYLTKLSEYDKYPMVSGTLFFGFLWSEIWGNNLIYIRVLAWLLGISSLVLPYFILISRTLWLKKMHYLTLGIIITGPFFINAYTPSIPTLFFLSLSLVFARLYSRLQKNRYLMILGILLSFSVFLRFPNILSLPFVILFIPLAGSFQYFYKDKKFWYFNLKKLIIFVMTYFVLFYITSLIIHGSSLDYFSKLQESISSSSAGSHSLKLMILRILKDLNKIVIYTGVLFLFDYIFYYYKKYMQKGYKILMLSMACGLFLFFMYYELLGVSYCYNLKLFYSSLVFFILLKVCFKNLENNNYKAIIQNLILLVFAFILQAGSITGLMGLSSILICFMPILLVESGFSFKKNMYLMPFVIVFIFFIAREYTYTYEDSRMFSELTTTIKTQKKLNHVKTSPNRVIFIEDVMNEYSKLTINYNTHVVFFGKVSHVFYYLTQNTPPYPMSFDMYPDDNYEIESMKNQIKKTRPVIFFLSHYPNFPEDKISASDIEKMFLQNNYRVIIKTTYKIYIPILIT